MMAWYGPQNSEKPLDKLLLKTPKLDRLFQEQEFIAQLKKFNPKLLEYITNTPELIKQAIQYIAIPPKQSESQHRKYKYPLLAIQMIETETVCIINSFFKQTGESNHKLYIDYLFDILEQDQILMILAGYFFRVCNCLFNIKYKQLTQYFYSKPDIFKKLLKHSHKVSITNCIQLFLNLQASKSDKLYQERKKYKVDTVCGILKKIQQYKDNNQSSDVIPNLINVVNQIIQKYYLLLDGKELLEPILSQNSINLFFQFINSNNKMSFLSIMSTLTSIINYYSFSSLNNQDKNNQQFNKRNLQRLQMQPLIIQLNLNFQKIVIQILQNNTFNYTDFKLLQFLCHSVSLSSYSIYNTIRKINFFAILIDLLFKYQQANILHNLIQKTFLHIFASEKKIYQQYKQHVFCEFDIIGHTILPIININFNILKYKANFGHLMKIIKIYSSIQTMNQNIINAIKRYSDLWTRVSNEIIRPYQQLSIKQLGTYQIRSQQIPIEYKVKQISFIPPQIIKTLIIQNIDQQAKFLKQSVNNSHLSDSTFENSKTIMDSDTFFKLPTEQISKIPIELTPVKKQETLQKIVKNQKEALNQKQKQKQKQLVQKPNLQIIIPSQANEPTKQQIDENVQKNLDKKNIQPQQRANNFSQFLQKRKVQATQTIKLQRSTSQQKRFVQNKGGNKMASPSPRKKDKWSENGQQSTKQTKISLKKQQKVMPIPPSKKVTQSVIFTKKQQHTQPPEFMTTSLVDLNKLKDIKVKFVKSKKNTNEPIRCRKVEQKDMLFLSYLGINVSK